MNGERDGQTDDQTPPGIELAPNVWIVSSNLRYTAIRAQGPGGQSVNKVSTAIQLRVAIGDIQGLSPPAIDRLKALAGQRLTQRGEIIVQAQRHRSQLDNKRACLARLCDLVKQAVFVPTPRKKKTPTRGMIERRLRAKREHSEKKARRRRKRPDAGNDGD